MNTEELIRLEEQYGAHNYRPLDLVLCKGSGAWVWDVEGRKYLDLLCAYSALNFGHAHPELVVALTEQVQRLSLTSRAFRNDQLPLFYRDLCLLTGFESALAMNSGAEAVESAVKLARKWGYEVKGIPENSAEIIVCKNNFHGRTVSLISCSTEPLYRQGFGPFLPGFKVVPYGDIDAFTAALSSNTAAVLLEPIQGEGGIIVPPAGYLAALRRICSQQSILFVLDEIQTGLGRTGKLFAYQHEAEDSRPDILILGKALAGGLYPVSAILAPRSVMNSFTPGTHGSTFGGNPLGVAVAQRALKLLNEDDLVCRAKKSGESLFAALHKIESPYIREIRGRGLLIGIELNVAARQFCEKLAVEGVLCKETHETVIRIAPPLNITSDELQFAVSALSKVLSG